MNQPLDLADINSGSFIARGRKVALFRCTEPKVQDAYEKMMRDTFELSEDRYLSVVYPGALPDLTKDRDHKVVTNEKTLLYNALKLLTDKKFRKLVIAPHTNCDLDSENHKFLSANADLEFQQRKVTQNFIYMTEVVRTMNASLHIVPAIIQVPYDQVYHFLLDSSGRATAE
jgi:hypothetical protein